jgi:predicted Co/Zn/Cd cation transporter (cation efflux family)
VFAAVFSIFIVAMVVLTVMTVRFIIRRDRERRRDYSERP